MPYIPKGELKGLIEEPSDTRSLCQRIVQIHSGDKEELLDSNESCDTRTQTDAQFIRIMDGYLREDFPEAHQGCSPEELRVPPVPHMDKDSGETFKLFWVPRNRNFSVV